jgi:ribonuclease E
VGEGAAGPGDGEREGRRRRRRRGGRRDDAGGDQAFGPSEAREESSSRGEATTAPTADAADEVPTARADAPREREWARDDEPAAVRERAPSPVAALPVMAAQSVAPSVAPRSAPPAVPHFDLPTQELEQLADGAGLQWVQSDADKVRVVQQAIAAEPQPVHVPRERKPVVLPDDGPLVLVETRKDLSQFALPFERQAAAQSQQPPQ